MPRHPTPRLSSPKQLLQRIDRVAAQLNAFLIVIAVGLAIIDLTFLATREIVAHMPPVTRMTADMPQSSPD